MGGVNPEAINELKERGIHNFDAWAASFGRVVNNLEVLPEGSGFRVQQRFAEFVNLPELLAIFHGFTDVQTKQDLTWCAQKFPGVRARAISVQFMDDNRVAMIELAVQNYQVVVVEEKHYKLLAAELLDRSMLTAYR